MGRRRTLGTDGIQDARSQAVVLRSVHAGQVRANRSRQAMEALAWEQYSACTGDAVGRSPRHRDPSHLPLATSTYVRPPFKTFYTFPPCATSSIILHFASGHKT